MRDGAPQCEHGAPSSSCGLCQAKMRPICAHEKLVEECEQCQSSMPAAVLIDIDCIHGMLRSRCELCLSSSCGVCTEQSITCEHGRAPSDCPQCSYASNGLIVMDNICLSAENVDLQHSTDDGLKRAPEHDDDMTRFAKKWRTADEENSFY